MSANQYPVFTAVSASGNSVFLNGGSVTQFRIGMDGPVNVAPLSSSSVFGSSTMPSALKQAILASGGNPWQAEQSKVTRRALDATGQLQQALAAVKVPTLPTTAQKLSMGGQYVAANCPLARQMRMVTQLVAANSRLGARRQIFMVQLPGFDSHNAQMR